MSLNTRLLFFLSVTIVILSIINYLNRGYKALANTSSGLELGSVCVDELCGYINNKGQWYIPPKFRAADPFSKDGLAWVISCDGLVEGSKYTGVIRKISDGGLYAPQSWPTDQTYAKTPYGGRFGLINAQGEFVVHWPVSDLIGPFSTGGLAAAEKSGKWGYINISGQWVIEPQFESAGRFASNGLASVKKGGSWGYINELDQWSIEPKYDFATRFGDDGLALASTANKAADWINTSGQKAGPRTSANKKTVAGKALTPTKLNDAWGYTDKDGQWVIEPRFDMARQFAENGLAAVSVGGNWGYINANGEWVIELQFSRAESFSANGLAAASMGGKYGYIDSNGHWAIAPQFNNFWSFADNGLAKVIVNSGRGVINTSGHWVVEPKYADLSWPGDLNGDLVKAFAMDPWPGVTYMTCFIDIHSGLYRTGLNEKIIEPGFRWEFVEGGKVIFNGQGKKILTIETLCGIEVAKNGAGEVIWPPKDVSDICQADSK